MQLIPRTLLLTLMCSLFLVSSHLSAQTYFTTGVGTITYNESGSSGIAFDTTATGHWYCFGNGYSKELVVKNFNMNVPTGAHVKGIKVDIDVIIHNLVDSSIFLLKNGIPYGTDGAHHLPILSAANIKWGDTATLWGGIWGPMALNDTNFGIKFRLRDINSSNPLSWGDANPVFITVAYDFAVPNNVNEISLHGLQVYPNPATNNINIDFGKALQNGSIRLININGSSVKEINKITGSYWSIDLSDQPTGFYILELYDNGTITRCKVARG
ncbi:hypothetical protein CJD36_017725 [Flavipsychrobacter stenotrophus]|uniref:Secretion system C-terminal sorting domain-containing protein n=1 Tax=Flavipsychrobacter stenotrophus TaxID=2077091 RepID=A0A2S7ST38_9BACT|nr:T9SS type A sorting domain-containing protein [Flavipsychrobacter stenotrophus]PQJ09767.1 hypothetical protein CJD36_017725 [Flavipsychrobacter stenotrophus]